MCLAGVNTASSSFIYNSPKWQKSLSQWGPSDTVRADGVQVKALTKDMIDEIVGAYAHVAGLVKRAGFEMLMVHGGHGWLINQFLSPMFNKREDEYGGTIENRARFAIEVLKAIREAVGPFFPIEFRMSGAEFVDEGYGIEDGDCSDGYGASTVAPMLGFLRILSKIASGVCAVANNATTNATNSDRYRFINAYFIFTKILFFAIFSKNVLPFYD